MNVRVKLLNDNMPYRYEEKHAMHETIKNMKMNEDDQKLQKKMISRDVAFRAKDADVTKMMGGEVPLK